MIDASMLNNPFSSLNTLQAPTGTGLAGASVSLPGVGAVGLGGSKSKEKVSQAQIKTINRSLQMLYGFQASTGVELTQDLMGEAQAKSAQDMEALIKNKVSAGQQRKQLEAELATLTPEQAQANPVEALSKVLRLDQALQVVEAKAMEFMAWAKSAVQPLESPPKKPPKGSVTV